MDFIHSILETIRNRQSIRTYDTEPLSLTMKELIHDYIGNKDNLIGPFGNEIAIELIEVTNNTTDKGVKIGTYGFIKNPVAYLTGIAKNNTYSLIDFGFCFEKLVLLLTERGIGTCWMGGTFSRKSFVKEMPIHEGQFIPAVSPIGYPKERKRIFDKALRYVVKADNKKSWDKLFYDGSFEKVLTKEKAGDFEVPLEMVRLGPSASNKQPWRILLSEGRSVCHFFIEHTPNYSSSFGYKMQLLDMGIAMCHFHLACKELGVKGEWEISHYENSPLPNENFEYLFTWRSNNL